jgi:hypothetical protein
MFRNRLNLKKDALSFIDKISKRLWCIQIKTAIRTIQSHVNKEHLQKYLDEYFYRLNRSIYKDSIFDNIFKRLVAHPHRGWKQIVVIK